MGVYIKGMEMPQNCICCDLSHEDGWCPAKQTFTDRYTFETCPLVPVPKHGRLIDADALMRHKGDCYDADGHLLYAVGTGNILCAPTIIPADPAEEGET